MTRAPLLLASLLLSALAPLAHAVEFEVGGGYGNAATREDPHRQDTWNAMAGVRFYNESRPGGGGDLGVSVIGVGSTHPWHRTPTGVAPVYDFDHAYAVQGVAWWHATDTWKGYVELGPARVITSSGTPGAGTRNGPDTILGVGLRWVIVPHVGFTIDVSRLYREAVTLPTARISAVF